MASSLIDVVQVLGQRPDPALDLAAAARDPKAERALALYARHRTQRLLAALPLRPHATPRRWRLQPLPAEVYPEVADYGGPQGVRARNLLAFLHGCHEVLDERGNVVRAGRLVASPQGGQVPADAAAWVRTTSELARGAAIHQELGALVLAFSLDEPDEAADPEAEGAHGPFVRYPFPPGLTLSL